MRLPRIKISTHLGHALAWLTRCTRAYYGYEDWPCYRGTSWPWRQFTRATGMRAMTIGEVTIFADHPTGALLRHEREHMEQARRLGWRYLPAYAWGCVIGLMRAIRAHHPMEKEARDAE